MLGQRKWDSDGNNRRTPYFNRRMEAWRKGHQGAWDATVNRFNLKQVRFNRVMRELGDW